MKKIMILICSLCLLFVMTGCLEGGKTTPAFRKYINEPAFYEAVLSDIYLFRVVDYTIATSETDVNKNFSPSDLYVYTIEIIDSYNEKVYNNLENRKAVFNNYINAINSFPKGNSEIGDEYLIEENKQYKIHIFNPILQSLFQAHDVFLGKLKPVYDDRILETGEIILSGESSMLVYSVYPVKDNRVELNEFELEVRNKSYNFEEWLLSNQFEAQCQSNEMCFYIEDNIPYYELNWADVLFQSFLFLNRHIENEDEKLKDGMTLEQFDQWLETVKTAQNEIWSKDIYESYPTLEDELFWR